MILEGPAGIGKTALLAAGRGLAVDEGFRVLRARGAELERDFAFGVVRQLFDPVMAGASRRERADLLDGPPGVAARLLGFPDLGSPADVAELVAPDPSFAVLHGLYWLCANLAAEQPLALVVDDAHWADRASLRFLAFLMPRLEELRVAVLLAARPAEAGESQELLAALTIDIATEVVTVGPLTSNGVATLVAAGLGSELEPEFAVACEEATGGTPFLVHTLVEALLEERIAPVAASAGKVKNVATATLDRWAMVRLSRLGPDACRLARAVAVMEQAEMDLSARLAELTLPDAAKAADLLVRAGVLEELPLRFAHPLLRSAVYREMAVGERDRAHGCAARLLAEVGAGPARVAEHLLASTPTGDTWTVEQLRNAAKEAAASGAPDSAVTYLRRASTETTSVTSDLHLELGSAAFSAGKPDWYDHLRAAVESAEDDTMRVSAALLFANALRWHERTAEAVEVCDRVAANLDGRDTEDHLMLEAVAVSFGRMDATTAPALAERGAVLMERARRGVVPRAALAVAAYQAALANQPADEVAALAHRAIIAGTRPIPDSSDPLWFVWAVTSLFYAERYCDAQTLFDAALREAQAAANGLILPVVLALSAWLALRRGDLTAAEADAHASLDAGSASGQPLILISASTALVETLIERGDLDGAERALEPIADRLQGISQSAAMARHVRGRLRFSRQRFSEALGDFLAAGEITLLTGAISPAYLPWRSAAALSAVAIGERDEARRLSDEEVDLARAFGAPRALGVALRASGLVAGGQRGETLLREAIEVLSGPDTRLEQARAQTDLGALLRRGNQRVEARQPLRRAIDTAHHLGAATLAERAETELRVAGAKPRRVFLTGLEALTASERRIAELAANGLTNREIAQTLFITDRTVEGHLTHVFTKLGVRTRTSLPAALNAPTQAVRS